MADHPPFMSCCTRPKIITFADQPDGADAFDAFMALAMQRVKVAAITVGRYLMRRFPS